MIYLSKVASNWCYLICLSLWASNQHSAYWYLYMLIRQASTHRMEPTLL